MSYQSEPGAQWQELISSHQDPSQHLVPCHLMLQVQWRALNEIDAGSCDGLTYLEIKQSKPDEYM